MVVGYDEYACVVCICLLLPRNPQFVCASANRMWKYAISHFIVVLCRAAVMRFFFSWSFNSIEIISMGIYSIIITAPTTAENEIRKAIFNCKRLQWPLCHSMASITPRNLMANKCTHSFTLSSWKLGLHHNENDDFFFHYSLLLVMIWSQSHTDSPDSAAQKEQDYRMLHIIECIHLGGSMTKWSYTVDRCYLFVTRSLWCISLCPLLFSDAMPGFLSHFSQLLFVGRQ